MKTSDNEQKKANRISILTWSALEEILIICLRYCRRDVCRTRMRSKQPSARWALGERPSGLLAHAHEIFAPMTLMKRPLMERQPERKNHSQQHNFFSLSYTQAYGLTAFFVLRSRKKNPSQVRPSTHSPPGGQVHSIITLGDERVKVGATLLYLMGRTRDWGANN